LKIVIVVPAYNEAASIQQVLKSISHVGTTIVVDDASDDLTSDIATKSGAIVVRHESNRGYDGALQSGFEKADEIDADVIVTFDADGQHDSEILTSIIEPLLNNNVDLVLGVRDKPARFSEWLFNCYGNLRFGVPDLLCGLKGYKVELYKKHGRFDGTKSIGTELALAGLRYGVNVKTVAVPIYPRQDDSRLGSILKANLSILRALLQALKSDCVNVFKN